MLTTPLHPNHTKLGAQLAPFAGWEMPIHYGSQIEEHHQVRRAAGLFDVSHMMVADLAGSNCQAMLQNLLANDVGKLNQNGRALYSCMLNHDGGVIDDLIVYRRAADQYRLVLNAGTAESDLAWIDAQAGSYKVTIKSRQDLAILALQGPTARQLMATLVSDPDALLALGKFRAAEFDQFFIARTGYTGEDGFEIILPKQQVVALWEQLLALGAAPTGLGARDTLRLEAGLCLYGQDLDQQHTPLQSGLNWTIAWQPEARDFIGRTALTTAASSYQGMFAGLLLEDKGVLRSGMTLLSNDQPIGITTSGGFAPTLQRSIALARLSHKPDDALFVDIRGKQKPVRIVTLPFARNGNIMVDLQSAETES